MNNTKHRIPSRYLSVDETLYPYRGHIGMKQYILSKPVKCGILYRRLCDAKLPYTYYTLTYAGRPEEISGKSHHVTSTPSS